MKEIYRIKKGALVNDSFNIPFDFGLVFENDGVFHFDIYTSESFDLNSMVDGEHEKQLFSIYRMDAISEENNEIEVTNLSVDSVIPKMSKMKLHSFGYLRHKNIKEPIAGEIKEVEDKNQTLYYLEIEGLKMEFSNHTQNVKARGGVRINKYNEMVRDHTDAYLIQNDPEERGCNNFKMIFFQNKDSDNVYIKMPNFKEVGPNVLKYSRYLKFKKELISLLSLLNGAEVAVRKEYIGGFYTLDKINTQTTYSYSFKTIRNGSHSKYIPLNNGYHWGDNILNNAFQNCFDKYLNETFKLDFDTIIFYLNGAEQSKSIEEKFFILIIALERLAQKFVDSRNDCDAFILSDEHYSPIRDEIQSVLDKHRSSNKDSINKLKARVGDLNRIKRTSTRYKFLKLLEYANIVSTPDIEHIIDEVRHKAIHHGDIEQGRIGLKNYFVLDELIRDIILNIIGYKGARISRYRPHEGSK